MIRSVLLTRSKLLNAEIKTKLQASGYDVLECNLIKYALQPFDISELRGYENLIITSYFAALNLPDRNINMDASDSLFSDINAWVVGMKSAKLLEAKGYKVQFCASSAEELKQNIPKEIYDSTIYLSSDHITVSMPEEIERKIFYTVKYKESLSSEQLSRYKNGIDYILIYSTNCAKTLIKLLVQNNLMNYLENTMLIVISSKVEKVVKRHFRNVQVCQGADLMLDYLEKQ
ncbi:MAG: uroporphyrinogen-III synthase [Rickettsiaceae bacterium]|nr:uroporphyrinogen-III synthase [Rickettsiaceae bacterium]